MLKLELKLLKATRRTTQTNNSKSPYVFIGRRLARNCQFTIRAKYNCMEYISTEGQHQRLESSVTTKRRVMKAKMP